MWFIDLLLSLNLVGMIVLFCYETQLITIAILHIQTFARKTIGVKIIHCFDPEYLVGTFGQFIYDLNCILNSRRQNFDVILQLGYTSNSIWRFLLPKAAKVVTNMDGLEWKRTKYTPLVQKFLKYAEKLAAKSSDVLIADSLGIQTYLKKKYKLESTYIPYGASIPEQFKKSVLEEYNVLPFSYDMLVARMEPENNIEVILDGHCASNQSRNFLVIGNHQGTKFGKFDVSQYHQILSGRFFQILCLSQKVQTLLTKTCYYLNF